MIPLQDTASDVFHRKNTGHIDEPADVEPVFSQIAVRRGNEGGHAIDRKHGQG